MSISETLISTVSQVIDLSLIRQKANPALKKILEPKNLRLRPKILNQQSLGFFKL